MMTNPVITQRGKRKCITHTFMSLDAAADYAAEHWDDHDRARTANLTYESMDDWRGGAWQDILHCAHYGWADMMPDALNIAEDAVELCERQKEIMRPEMVFDVTGDYVDIGRYVSGEPECMVDYPLVPVSDAGKVITLVVGGFMSAALSKESAIKRGQVIAALALVLSRLGYALELWVDMAGKVNDDNIAHIKTMVKGPDDTLDPAKILFALAHPGMFRGISFAIMNSYPTEFYDKMYARLHKVDRNFPEGTIYLEGIEAYDDKPDAHEALKGYLRELGLLAE